MCLSIDWDKTKRGKKRIGERIFYKAVAILTNGEIRSPYKGTLINAGYYNSYRDPEISDLENSDGSIRRGIHVFTNKKSAYALTDTFWSRAWKIIPVKANMKDLVAYGRDDDAVFVKIRIKKSDLDKAKKICG